MRVREGGGERKSVREEREEGKGGGERERVRRKWVGRKSEEKGYPKKLHNCSHEGGIGNFCGRYPDPLLGRVVVYLRG